MVSLAVDVLICAVLLGAGYLFLLQRPQAGTAGSSTSSKKRKNKSKAKSSKKDEIVASSDAAGSVSASENKRVENGTVNGSARAATKANGGPSKPVASAATNTSHSSSGDDFPPLPAASSPKIANNNPTTTSSQPKPLAERMGKKKQRKSAVNDMLDSDDELRAPTYKQTMRIIKPKPDAPLISDSTGHEPQSPEHPASPTSDGWEKPPKPDAWQTVAQKSEPGPRSPEAQLTHFPAVQNP